MLMLSIVLIILANAITYRSEKSLSFNRVTIIILLYTFVLGWDVNPLNSGIGVYGGLFHITAITQNFVVFISILAVIYFKQLLTPWFKFDRVYDYILIAIKPYPLSSFGLLLVSISKKNIRLFSRKRKNKDSQTNQLVIYKPSNLALIVYVEKKLALVVYKKNLLCLTPNNSSALEIDFPANVFLELNNKETIKKVDLIEKFMNLIKNLSFRAIFDRIKQFFVNLYNKIISKQTWKDLAWTILDRIITKIRRKIWWSIIGSVFALIEPYFDSVFALIEPHLVYFPIPVVIALFALIGKYLFGVINFDQPPILPHITHEYYTNQEELNNIRQNIRNYSSYLENILVDWKDKLDFQPRAKVHDLHQKIEDELLKHNISNPNLTKLNQTAIDCGTHGENITKVKFWLDKSRELTYNSVNLMLDKVDWLTRNQKLTERVIYNSIKRTLDLVNQDINNYSKMIDKIISPGEVSSSQAVLNNGEASSQILNLIDQNTASSFNSSQNKFDPKTTLNVLDQSKDPNAALNLVHKEILDLTGDESMNRNPALNPVHKKIIDLTGDESMNRNPADIGEQSQTKNSNTALNDYHQTKVSVKTSNDNFSEYTDEMFMSDVNSEINKMSPEELNHWVKLEKSDKVLTKGILDLHEKSIPVQESNPSDSILSSDPSKIKPTGQEGGFNKLKRAADFDNPQQDLNKRARHLDPKAVWNQVDQTDMDDKYWSDPVSPKTLERTAPLPEKSRCSSPEIAPLPERSPSPERYNDGTRKGKSRE